MRLLHGRIRSGPSLYQLQFKRVVGLSQASILAALSPQDGSEAPVNLTCASEEVREPAEEPQRGEEGPPWEWNLQPPRREATALVTAPGFYFSLVRKLGKGCGDKKKKK